MRTPVSASPSEVLVFDTAGVRELDRRAVKAYGIPSVLLMENAASGAAAAARELLETRAGGTAIIVCGPGNNGGDGYALARHLANSGAAVCIASIGEPREGSDGWINRRVVERMGLPIEAWSPPQAQGPALIVDAIFGTGLDREAAGDARRAIEWMNRSHDSGAAVLALDVPSGMHADTGRPLGACVRADVTATFVGWKKGFLAKDALDLTGEVRIVDIGAPRRCAEELALGRLRRDGSTFVIEPAEAR
jgi:hydroxyethylthiazole kinase-like uncharacterized protein yjeF